MLMLEPVPGIQLRPQLKIQLIVEKLILEVLDGCHCVFE